MAKNGFVLVRGGVSGAGRHMSVAFAKAGYNVFADFADPCFNYRGDYLVEEVSRFGVKCAYHSADPGKFECMRQSVDRGTELLGENLAIYVNNDGCVDGRRLKDLSPAQYNELIEMHFNTILNCSKAAAEDMGKHGGGVVITTAALMPPPGGEADFELEIDLYRAFTKSLAKTYAAQNVRFNTLLSAPLNYPPDREPPEEFRPKQQDHAIHFMPPMSTEAPDVFLDMLVKIAEAPLMNGQVLSHNVRF